MLKVVLVVGIAVANVNGGGGFEAKNSKLSARAQFWAALVQLVLKFTNVSGGRRFLVLVLLCQTVMVGGIQGGGGVSCSKWWQSWALRSQMRVVERGLRLKTQN